MKNILSQIKNIPVSIWVLILLAFVLGFVIRGSGDSGSEPATHDHSAEEKVEFWTCSMHPQIKLSEPGQCPICFMDLIPLKSGNSSDRQTQLKMSSAAMKLAEIQTSIIRRSPAMADIFLSGCIEIDETRQKTISAWFPGRLERLYVDYTGTSVKKGDHLADIYSAEIYTAQEELIQARQIFDAVSSNQSISERGTIANLQATREKLRLAGLTMEQINLIEKQTKPDEQITIYSPLSGIIAEKHTRQGDYVQTGTKIYTITDLSQVWVIFDGYESDFFWLNYAQTVEFEVRALPGEKFKSRIAFIDPIFDSQTRTISIRVNMPNPDGKLKPGMFVRGKIHAELDAEGNSINPQLAGKWISPMHPEIVKDHPGVCDICGMPLVKAEELGIVKEPPSDELPLLVPASAVLRTGKRAIVYVKVPNTDEPTFESREILIGTRAGDYYIVLSGLSEGEEVVTHGNFKIDSAMQLSAKPSMMSPTVTGPDALKRHQTAPASTANKSSASDNIPIGFRDDLTPIYNAYFNAQTALADDSYPLSKKHLKQLSQLLDSFEIEKYYLSNEAKHSFSKQSDLITGLTQSSKHWQSIEGIRKAFEGISITILNWEKTYGHSGDQTFYESYCPMAFDDKGASWLAREKQISNPFFGLKMLQCGEVISSFPAVNSLNGEHKSHD